VAILEGFGRPTAKSELVPANQLEACPHSSIVNAVCSASRIEHHFCAVTDFTGMLYRLSSPIPQKSPPADATWFGSGGWGHRVILIKVNALRRELIEGRLKRGEQSRRGYTEEAMRCFLTFEFAIE
jgi:hypothetical protein